MDAPVKGDELKRDVEKAKPISVEDQSPAETVRIRNEKIEATESVTPILPILPGVYGVKASLLLLVSTVIVSLIVQQRVNEVEIDNWTNDCPTGYDLSCKKNQSVLRFSFSLVIFYTVQLIFLRVDISYFDSYWAFKTVIFACLTVGLFYADPRVFDLNGYGWYARIAGFLFLILQQIILLDFAYQWNETFLQYSVDNVVNQKINGMDKWKCFILIFSILLFITSIISISIMFWKFSGSECSNNEAIISLTLILSFISTMFQLFCTDQGSILTSAIMTLYATWVCYASITLNPLNECNPTITEGKNRHLSEGIGMAILAISLAWTTRNTIRKIPNIKGNTINLSILQGDEIGDKNVQLYKNALSESSLVLILVSSFYAMVLTNWVTLKQNSAYENPKTGYAAMWIQATAQWIAIAFYFWSLVAPKLFPDRDFGPGHR